jgi:molybdopterin molybdotransferase
MRDADWVPLREAVTRVLAAVEPLEPESVPLGAGLGRVIAETVVSSIDQPPWDNSAMDGFAVRAADVRDASAERPVVLRVIESIPAGGFPTRSVGVGEATRIMTGAPVPDGADGVVRVEHTRDDGADAAAVTVIDASDAGRNVRFRGEDIARGAVVLEPGRLLRPAEIGVLATVGHARVRVHRRPRVAILSTGDELAALDAFDAVRAGRRIVDSNSHALAAAVLATGAGPVPLGIARDDADHLRERLRGADDADLLLTTAGASVGDHDIVKDVLESLGFELGFWRVRMRPGSPVSFGLLPRPGRTPLPVFGLPGNPVSALVTWELLARPAVRRMAGRTAVHTPTHVATLDEDVTSTPRLTHFLRVRLRHDADGTAFARLTGAQGSGIASSMAAADALLVVPEGVHRIRAGETARVMPLTHADRATETFDL